MSDLDDKVQMVAAKIEALAENLASQWDIENQLTSAPASKLKSLEQLRDDTEKAYEDIFEDIKKTLLENHFPEGKQLDAIMKRISGTVYNSASDKFTNKK